jgi:murein tripeptide amidase MpaA
MKKIIIWLVVVVILVVGGYLIFKSFSGNAVVVNTLVEEQNIATTTVEQNPAQTIIGKSVEGRDIVAYNFGTGTTKLLFVGGIHGGYEWNTALVAFQLVNYLKQNPDAVPSNLKVTVIPVLNPDGLNKTVGTSTGNFSASDVPSSQDKQVAGRFNANNVDLNRNFDCDWQATGKWQNKNVSGGTSAFSEPESQSVKNYVETNKPSAVLVWYSSAGGVYASSCHNGVSAETNTLTKKYADASGYPAFQDFNFYEITGDMVNWLAKKNIPAISVLLTNHTDTEWTKNQKGIKALLDYYALQ